ncbi:negative regulator of genetic competence, sporulation and motility [Staphylococcus caledonicus]
MTNIREEKVTKGKVLVESTFNAGKATAFRQSIDLIVRKMDLITDKDSKEYNELSEVINLLWAMHDVAEKSESEANEKLDEIFEQEKNALSQADQSEDNA